MQNNARKVGTLHFSIEGAFVLNIAREEAIYGSWKKAINMLIDSFVGMSHDHAILLLRGDKTLTGWDSDIEMVDESPAVRKQLSDDYLFQYQDVLFHQGQYYKASYYFESSRSRNAYLLNEFGGGAFSYERKGMYSEIEHASFYFDDPYGYHVTCHTHNVELSPYWVVWEKVNRIPPLWFKDETDADVIMTRKLMSGQFCHLIELDDDSCKPRALGYVSDYGLNSVSLSPASIGDSEDRQERQAKAKSEAIDRSFELSRLRQEIWQQNGDKPDDYIVLLDKYKVPIKPLKNWALSRSEGAHLAPKWSPVSESGWKMHGDDPYHTDWVIAAGVDPALIYDKHSDLNDAASKWRFDYEREVTNAELSKLVVSRASKVEDKVQHVQPSDTVTSMIVYIPDCSTKWMNIAKQVGKNGGVILTKTGGQLSHLVMNGDDYGITLLMHPDADTIFKNGVRVEIDAKSGTYHFPMISVEEMMARAMMRSAGI